MRVPTFLFPLAVNAIWPLPPMTAQQARAFAKARNREARARHTGPRQARPVIAPPAAGARRNTPHLAPSAPPPAATPCTLADLARNLYPPGEVATLITSSPRGWSE